MIMGACLRYITILSSLFMSSVAWSQQTTPEAVVVIAYISTLRCEAQHPKLKKDLEAAFKAWENRNHRYVVSAHKRVDFSGIANLYKTRRKHDKRIPYETCKLYIKRLRDPRNDIKNPKRKKHR